MKKSASGLHDQADIPQYGQQGLLIMRVFRLTLITTILASSLATAGEQGIIEAVADDAARSSNLALQLAPLKSAADVYRYHQAIPVDLSPLSALGVAERTKFIQSLRFNAKGLTQFDYTALKSLSPSEVYIILALFGLQSSAGLLDTKQKAELDGSVLEPMLRADFLLDHYCESRGTCREDSSRACTSNC